MSWEDLSLAVTGKWSGTYAQSIWSDSTTTYVAGYGFNDATLRYEALLWRRQIAVCYANCDNSTMQPILNVNDFVCFSNRFAAGNLYANCDRSTTAPVLNVNDFICFMSSFAAGCS